MRVFVLEFIAVADVNFARIACSLYNKYYKKKIPPAKTKTRIANKIKMFLQAIKMPQTSKHFNSAVG